MSTIRQFVAAKEELFGYYRMGVQISGNIILLMGTSSYDTQAVSVVELKGGCQTQS